MTPTGEPLPPMSERQLLDWHIEFLEGWTHGVAAGAQQQLTTREVLLIDCFVQFLQKHMGNPYLVDAKP